MKLILIWIFMAIYYVEGWRRRRRRRRSPPPRPPRPCRVGPWSSWSRCSHQCGNAGIQSRTRVKTVTECCGGRCPYHFRETRPCNRNACRNGGRPTNGRCNCNAGWTGTCCERDVNECLRRPCQHKCHNVPGSYTCSCYSCYTKVGTKCELRQCRISGACYSYGSVNPRNQCQDCQKSKKTSWSNNDKLSCSDGNLCTRNDRCIKGVCTGNSFTCRSCESCDGSSCKIKPGFCVIDGKCYSHGDLRSGKPCQQCNSNNPKRWTANNNLKCSDGNVKTRNDRCVNGECSGTPFTCLSCQDHYNDACKLKSGYCVIKNAQNVDSCYRAKLAKPGNSCQWCEPKVTTFAWTNRNGVSCDDGQKCTRQDKCKNGQCRGASFKCNTLCQYCNGNGCSLKQGFGFVNGKCTCKIAGRDYSHQQVNPSNQCQWCNLYDKASKRSLTWSNKPSVSCNDGNACTKQDVCQTGRCVGKSYSCQQIYPKASCIKRSECIGDGTCRDIMRDRDTICRSPVDRCDQPERCDGVLGTCPLRSIDVITHKRGEVMLTSLDFASSLSYQATTDKFYLKITGFSVNCGTLTLKWSLLKGQESCSARNVSGTLPSTSNQILSGLSLKNGQTYKILLQSYDMRNKVKQTVCSNVVTIDTTKPSGGWVRDGLGTKDIQYQSSKKVSATWGGFTTTHGIKKYEVAVYYKSKTLTSFINVNLNASFSKTISTLRDGSQIIIKVRAFTKAGLYSEVSSNGVIVDTSKPKAGIISDGLSIDKKYANWTTTYEANWQPYSDNDSPITEYKIGVKRKNGALVSSGFISVGRQLKGKVTGLSLTSGIEYCALVKGINAAGLSAQAASNCLLIDHIAPQPGVVNDGASDDIDYQSADNVFRANWKGFTDGKNGSGIMEYMHKITDNSGRQITNWFSVGLQTKATVTGLNLVNGRSYFITVKAIDKVGHFVEVRSDGIYIDISHPVYTGKLLVQGETGEKNGKRVIYLRNNNSLSVSWPQFLDEQSGMLKYQWSIVEVNSTVTTWSDVPGVKLSTKAVLSSLSLENNKEYRLTIRGINNAGLYSDIKSSVLIPQSEAPQEGNVLDGEDPNVDIDYQTNSSMIQATWYGFDTPNVKVRKYYIAVGSCIEGNYHVTNNGFVAVHPMTATSFELHDLSLVNGQKYCIKVKAENLAGVETKPVSSDGFIVDTSPPDLSHAMVLDGSGEDDVDFQSSTTEISFTWSGIKDPDSGIEHFEVAISRNRIGQPDVTSYFNVGQNTSASLSGLRLSKKVYYVIVCALNMAGLRSCTSSDGVLVDPTPSTVGFVYDGLLAPDINYQSSLTKMSANWERIWDLESRIERFEWAIVDNYQNMVMKFVDVGLQTHVTTEKALKLMHNRTYIVYLRVYNRAGGLRELHSNGVTIDTTSPIPTDIVLGAKWRFDQKTGNYYSSSATGINVTWRNYKEFESELWYYKWGIGTSKCGTQTQQLINIGLSTSTNTSRNELVFQQGIHYYVTVVARNRANLVSQSCTPGLIFDYSPPQIGRIHIKSETRDDKTYFNSLKGLRITWQDFIDPESDIKLFEISLKQSNKTISKSILTASKGPFEYYLNGLSSATWYFAAVKAINYAGLETEGFSKPFIIDETVPFYTGRERGVPKKQYQSDTTSVKITWKTFDDKESPIEYYEIGIGTGQTRDNIFNFTKTGLIKEIQLSNLELLENNAYYVSVRATNAAGLSTTLYLSRIYIDKTPPFGKNTSVRDGLSMYDINFISLNDSVSANWDAIKDEESGIEKYEYCVGTTPFNCLVKHFTSVNKNNSYVCNDCQVYADMKIYTTIKATNEAGLSAMFTSNGVRVDSTPPEIGDILDGDVAQRPDAENVDATWTPAVTWYGVRDIQSGIQGCEWIILRKGEDIPIFKKRLNSTSYDNRHTERLSGPIQNTNASYVNLIRCTNNAGMVSERTSNGWSVVEEWPVILYVHDGNGPSDIDYVTEGEIIRASWKIFNGDGKDPVVSYEWAVGDIVDPKAIMEYENVGLRTQVSKSLVESDAELQPGKMYFVTVRARALSGRMSNKTSNGFMVDNSPPVPGVVKVEHKIVNQTINELDYSLNWDNFKDPESGIRVYEYCLGYVKNVCATPLTSAALENKQLWLISFQLMLKYHFMES
ncbi:uncharacterized protein LOC124445941 [Xenia sp. Carnegie-2017]|uniref:uncharacterized protein LOC124445941 n=1 Tax=Xenia sp. Carnegie-2017 TaxID=2897299 RepID=UPI001F037A07|nr:uncharacterized protein LOC124445941 [Xenia sp. Carnegie-2017]